jgi:hypothetical protein
LPQLLLGPALLTGMSTYTGHSYANWHLGLISKQPS